MQLAWTPVADATATKALSVLARLVRKYGPPLVLKSDNGSAFLSAGFAAWLARWQILSLLSPVRMPRYNGACEAGIGAAICPRHFFSAAVIPEVPCTSIFLTRQ